MTDTVRRAAIGTALFAGTLLLYAAVCTHEFVNLDDRVFILENATLPLGWTVAGIRQALTSRLEAYWIPLTALSFQANWAVHGFAPCGYLLTNVVLHAANVVLLFAALVRMTGATWRSAAVAAIFAVHPLHVESVAWASERKDVLSGLFFLLGLWLYGGARGDRLSAGRRWGVLAALVAGLLAKPMIVTMPFVLLLLDVWPLGRPLTVRRITEKLPLFAVVAMFTATTMYTQSLGGALAFGQSIPIAHRVATALESWVWYAWATAWPTGLAVFYPYADQPLGAHTILHAAILAAVTLAVLVQARRRPWWTVGWLWYVGMLVPVIGLVQAGMQARADRFMYLPLVGLALAVVWAWPARARVAGALAIAAMTVLAWRQIGFWSNSITLFERAVAVTTDNDVAHARLGEEYRAAGRLDLAEWHYREAIRIRPARGGPHRMLASLRASLGDRREAEQLYRRAIELDPHDVQSQGDLGLLLAARGAWPEAQATLARAVAIDPTSLTLANALGVAAARAGDPVAAKSAFEQAHALAPDDGQATNNLAWLLATSANEGVRDPARALALIGPLSQAHPEIVEWLDTRAAAHAATGDFATAVRIALEARERATARGDAASVAQLDRRIERYRAGAPVIEGSAAP